MENDFWFSSRRLSASLHFTISNLWKMISGFHLDVHLFHYIFTDIFT